MSICSSCKRSEVLVQHGKMVSLQPVQLVKGTTTCQPCAKVVR